MSDTADPPQLAVVHRVRVPAGGALHARGHRLRAPRVQGLQGREQGDEARLQLVQRLLEIL